MGEHSKKRVLKRMRARRQARASNQAKGTDKLVNFVLLIFTLAAVVLVLAVFLYFDL